MVPCMETQGQKAMLGYDKQLNVVSRVRMRRTHKEKKKKKKKKKKSHIIPEVEPGREGRERG